MMLLLLVILLLLLLLLPVAGSRVWADLDSSYHWPWETDFAAVDRRIHPRSSDDLEVAASASVHQTGLLATRFHANETSRV